MKKNKQNYINHFDENGKLRQPSNADLDSHNYIYKYEKNFLFIYLNLIALFIVKQNMYTVKSYHAKIHLNKLAAGC